jgi:hypothetical protein
MLKLVHSSNLHLRPHLAPVQTLFPSNPNPNTQFKSNSTNHQSQTYSSTRSEVIPSLQVYQLNLISSLPPRQDMENGTPVLLLYGWGAERENVSGKNLHLGVLLGVTSSRRFQTRKRAYYVWLYERNGRKMSCRWRCGHEYVLVNVYRVEDNHPMIEDVVIGVSNSLGEVITVSNSVSASPTPS